MEKDKKCNICLKEFQKLNSKCCPGCKKILHIDCIVNSGQAQCPFCRKEVNIPEQYKEKFEEKKRELKEYNNLEALTREELINLNPEELINLNLTREDLIDLLISIRNERELLSN